MQIRKTLTLLFVTILVSTLFHIGFISNPSIAIPPQSDDEPFVLGPIAGLSENKNGASIRLWSETEGQTQQMIPLFKIINPQMFLICY